MKRLIRASRYNEGLFALSPREYELALNDRPEDAIRRILTHIQKARGYVSGVLNKIDTNDKANIKLLNDFNELSEYLTKAYDKGLRIREDN